MRGWRCTAPDRRQEFYLRRLAFALLVGGAAHTLVCWLTLQWGFFRGGENAFWRLFAVIWGGHLALLAFAQSGANRRLRDPAMTEPLMIWSTLVLLLSVVFVEQAQLAVMTFFFAVLHQGVFRVRRRAVARAAVVAVAGYGLVLLSLRLQGDLTRPAAAWSQWLLFAFTTLAMVLLASEISTIRLRLRQRNGQLSELLERIQDLAVKDELTGLYSRRHAMELLAKSCGQARRGAFLLAVAFVDLDHFKRINDRHGHLFGDRVLMRFADLTRRYLGEKDLAARLGGEEFLLVLPVLDLAQARATVEGLMTALRAQRFMAAPALEVTASVGLTVVGATESPDQVLARADRLLYQAKTGGRDRIVIEGPP
ncbi:GGDEF domain-containing protein [Alloalcanivorax profundimaris]|uniref:diguanylate cyclase n=1 Tax=Alloalcanivorax profundimaris TaxID=2735259 RepID=A0ABS0AQM6_9GAMM|nr:GGDEF domain-containing protein [Alloalcanivorax profundimaris]MAO58048.1 GGDEF domain-containing protein [Alcanivorax sp.]MBM1145235.1 GGDEF domain-containing protein [Alcanivorax sp. ZXX171]MCQ6261859.1 GGDEF domain-containing protein [Alcanivorax sp. MM125-6]UWN48716.1 putative diguanylate cyclase YedQ [Alcanivorax sp. ALC70]MBF1800953.1 GGDEF domain-containing protein [Alloalcanivorax profundimaris]|tara:strand:- start:3262 stop:4362 length:1101 start_codon:yes stop_codon:yes gene_type:complete